MADLTVPLVVAAGVLALLSSNESKTKPIFESEAEEKQFEICWFDPQTNNLVFEGLKGKIVLVDGNESLLPTSFRCEWTRRLVDQAALQIGTGTETLWIRKAALRSATPSHVWAFHSGAPLRTEVVRLWSGRLLHGVLPEVA